jgi:hypothetical protein
MGHLNLVSCKLWSSRSSILSIRNIIHINLIDVGLLIWTQVLLWSLYTSTVLLIQCQRGALGNFIRSGRPHLILWGIPSAFHGWLDDDPISAYIGIGPTIIGLIATHGHIIISPHLWINTALELLGLAHSIIVVLLLLDICTALTVCCETTTTSRLCLPVRVSVLPTFLTENDLLSIIFEEVHTGVGATTSLFKINEILRLLHKLIVSIPTSLGEVELTLCSSVSTCTRISVLRMSHFRLAWFAVVLRVTGAQMLTMGGSSAWVDLLLLILKTVIIILFQTSFTLVSLISRSYVWRLPSGLLAMVGVAVVLDVNIVVNVVRMSIAVLTAMTTLRLLLDD